MSQKKNKKNKSNPKKKAARKKVVSSSFWKQKDLLIPALIAIAITAMIFIPSLSNDFVNWDDDVNILENENLEVFNAASIQKIFSPTEGNVIGNYNPLTIFTFAVIKHLFGLNPQAFHSVNLLLHLLCVFLVYRIMLLMKIGRIGALLVALLFGIHPMRVESVAWITELKDVLFGAFYLSAIFYYVKYLLGQQKNKKYYAFILILFFLSLMSKIQAVSLPLSMLALDYYFRREFNLKLIIEKIPFFALSLFFGLLGIYTLGLEGSLNDDVTTYSFGDRLLIGAYSYTVYLIKVVVPYEMFPMYPYPKFLTWHFYAAPVAVLASLVGIFVAFKKDYRAIVFAWAFFLVNVVFLLQILGAGQGFIADRFTYIPYLGLFFLVGYLYQYLEKEKPKFKQYLLIGMGAYLAIGAFMTVKQIGIWENGEKLWSHIIDNSSSVTNLAHGNRAFYRRGIKQYDLALQDYNRAIQLNSKKSGLYNSRGKTYFDMGNSAKALEDYARAIQLDDSEVEYHVNQGAAQGSLGRFEEALKSLNKAKEVDPKFDNTYLNLSLAHGQLGMYDQAIEDITTYLTIKPYHADMWYERGLNYRRTRNPQKAFEDFSQAIKLNSKQRVYYYERAKALIDLGRKAEARQDIQMAQNMGIQVDPKILELLK